MSVVRLNSSSSGNSSASSSLLSDERQRERATAATAPLTPPQPALLAPLPQQPPKLPQRSQHQSQHQNHGYLGHFVLLCGFDARSNHFALRDPDGPARVRRVAAAALDEARAAFGTDEDLLLVELAGDRPASCVSVAFEEPEVEVAAPLLPVALPATPERKK